MLHSRVCGKTRILSHHVSKFNRDALRPPLRKTPGSANPLSRCQKIVVNARSSDLSIHRLNIALRLNPCGRSSDPRSYFKRIVSRGSNCPMHDKRSVDVFASPGANVAFGS